ncbi:DUF2631 domain-containing protein [Nocardia amikacinitolerans]|uniref:DUF2631 domain-containing protein n=1 Tax=Nocardia amikacinitolerans TaxID=756689 RepID=A0A285LUL7_9NOCA|nr:DUF2631 domain-containing protein [Nocardia amikacinitolerans]MCP2280248.1 Protein of unknown function (DUF2631) [Nocardia amikacinitolerans]MCP2287522.1 Protein of unknown function (DUF2631) [Nocardia amikacinitolerans]MCP2299523.1 Protein of unknown function (DUF2631) [Nocardia amikacinitolerans]MCP2316922.1 Protein of unknown function (DUF2631) [Nocardia amikacinitolerans]SNY88602.1 Protein of unknown function [Nocardia amikacinitolerans]
MAATDIEPANNERAVVTHVDTAEVPSAEWGWSGESRRTFRIAGWFVAFALLAMIIGNHKGLIEDIYLVGFAALIVVILVRDSILRRKPR